MKKIVLIAMVALSFSVNGQSREENFKNSYKEELKKNYSKAIEFIESEEFYDCYECNFRLGWLYYLAGDYTKSIQYYQAALDLEKGSIEGLYGLTYPYSALKKWDDLSNVYKTILKISPTQINALYYLGLSYYYKKDYANAKFYCQKILNLYPLNYYGNLFMGDILSAEGDANKAKEFYSIVSMLDLQKGEIEKNDVSKCYPCLTRLGWIYYSDKDYKNSLSRYEEAESINPKALETYYGKTYSYAMWNDIDNLQEQYKAILKIDNKNTYALYSLAYYQFQMKEIDEAEKNCSEVLKLFPFDYYSVQLMADIKTAQGKLDEAKIYLQRALIYNPNEQITKTKLQKLGKAGK